MTSSRTLLPFAAAAAVLIALTSPAHARRTISMRVPAFEVPPHSDREICTFVPVPMDEPFKFQKSVIVNVGASKTFATHHFLAWVYNGKDIEAFPPRGSVVESKACLDFGPADTNTRSLIAASQTVRLSTSLGNGLAEKIEPTTTASGKKQIGIILNSHWINSGDKPKRAAVRIKLTAAKPHTVKAFVLPIFEVTANAHIGVPPKEEGTERGFWGPGSLDFGGGALGGGSVPAANATACIVGVSSHMHKRGRLFTIDLVQGPVDLLGLSGTNTGTVITPGILQTTSYSDPPQIPLHGMPLRPGQYLRYTCTHDNGMDPAVPVKMGCEEQAGVPPGKSILQLILGGNFGFDSSQTGAARRCQSDADCAGFGTGKCVPANLVFGFTSDDDMCIMPGGYYPADTSGNCDLSTFPVLSDG